MGAINWRPGPRLAGRADPCYFFSLSRRGVKQTDNEFQPDKKIRLIAQAYAADAVDFARKQARAKLDWSDDSICVVERILDQLFKVKPEGDTMTEEVEMFAKMFGSYLGEVFRKNHNGEWGLVSSNGQAFAAMRTAAGELFWPWGKTQSRLENGEADNVWDYYRLLIPPE